MYTQNQSFRFLAYLLVVTGLLIFPVFPSTVRADAVWGEVFPLRQGDGTGYQVRVWGDEFYSVIESLDGHTLVLDAEKQLYCYADLSPDGKTLVSTGVPFGEGNPRELGLARHLRVDAAAAREAALTARAAQDLRFDPPASPAQWPYPPCVGDVRGICLIVDFVDENATVVPAEIDAFFNQEGYPEHGNNGSVRDYYFDVSRGLMNYTNYVPAVYYRAQRNKGYYENPGIPFRQRAQELIVEAIWHLDAQGFDFSSYDCNGDLLIDGISLYYAGSRTAGGGLWPHCGTMTHAVDGVTTNRYLVCDIGNFPTLFTMCHETGHMLGGWPDLYDYGGDSAGAGDYCLMSCYFNPDTNPPQPGAFCKAMAGWADLTDITSAPPGAEYSVIADSNSVCRFSHPTATGEYYLIENRQRIGRDADIPDDGLAIWHVDHSGCNDYQQGTPEFHYLVALIQADGNLDLENFVNHGDTTDLWGAPDYTECTPLTDPNTNWWDESASGLYVTNVSSSGPVMTFTIGGNVPVLVTGIHAIPIDSGIRIAWNISADEEILGFNLYRRGGNGEGKNLVNGSGLIPAGSRQFTDERVRPGITYEYTLGAVKQNGTEVLSRTAAAIVPLRALALEQNHPNPFNPSTTISFALPERARITIAVYSAEGRLVTLLLDNTVNGGLHTIDWDGTEADGSPAASGLYFCRLEAGGRALTRKMVLLK